VRLHRLQGRGVHGLRAREGDLVRLALAVGDAAALTQLVIAAFALLGLIGMAAGPTLLAAWHDGRTVVRHGTRSRQPGHRADGPATGPDWWTSRVGAR
jgi:hypothetical protein